MLTENEFTVPTPGAEVWAYLLEAEKVAKCLPGAELTEIVDAQTFNGRIKVKLGAMDLSFAGTGRERSVLAHRHIPSFPSVIGVTNGTQPTLGSHPRRSEMTRIPAVSPDEASPLIKLSYWYTKRRFGEVPEPFAVMANHPKLFMASAKAEVGAAKASTVLPAKVRNIAVYRAAWTIGCSWCVDFGTMLLRLDGLDVDRLKEIADYATSPRYSDDERAAIAYADAMTATPPEVADEQVADLERRFGRDGVVELTYHIALENLRSRMNSALGITAQGFSSGDACRVPWAEEATNGHTAVPA